MVRVKLAFVEGDFVRACDVGNQQLGRTDKFWVDAVDGAKPIGRRLLGHVALADGRCVGREIAGQLGILDEVDDATPVAEGVDHVSATVEYSAVVDVVAHDQRQ
jgi:hypothetical protein